MARSGTLGAIYQQGIEHQDDYEYIAHLGDCRSYAGFSGSPCFLELAMAGLEEIEPPLSVDPDEPGLGRVGSIKYAHLVCGMVTWHLEPPKDREESSIFGVVCILPSDYIWNALMSDGYRQQRREAEELPDEPEAVPKGVSSASPASGPKATSTEFENFEDLAKQLVNTRKKPQN